MNGMAWLLAGLMIAVPVSAQEPPQTLEYLQTELEAARQQGDTAAVERLEEAIEALATAQQTPVFDLERITVTGTRTPRTLLESPASVTIIDQEQLRRENMQTIQDLVRYEPGVTVRDDPRYGFQDFNIRGLDANRVLIQVDGIRQPERFTFGPFNLGRDYFEIETLRTVEIIRGPASSLYGSDALGGAVTLTTLEPADLLGDRDSAVYLSSRFSSVNGGLTNTVGLAGRQGNLEGMLLYTRRDFRERDSLGDPQFQDSVDGEGNNLLAKFVYRFNDFSSLRLTGEYFERRTNTTFAIANVARGVTRFEEGINTQRTRISLEYRYENPATPRFELASVQVFYQPARTQEPSVEERTLAPRPPSEDPPTPVRRDTFNELISDVLGLDMRFQSRFATRNAEHRLVYGLDVSSTFNSRPRDREQTNLLTGETTSIIPPNTFPTKDFPDSDTLRFGVYLQDEIELRNSNFTIIPGIRYDLYSLSPQDDPVFSASGAEAVSLSASAISPKLGLVWQLNPNLTLTAQYAAGFRAPQYNEINSGFTNLTGAFFRYRTLSNPDLRPETSQSFEVGLRGVYPQTSFRVAGYYNTYNDFIEAFREVGSEPSPPDSGIPGGPPPPPVILFQSQNVSQARIYGLEAGVQHYFNPELTGFSLNASVAWTVGDNTTENIPLLSVEPFTAVVGLHYDAPSERWGGRLIATLVADPRDPQRDVVQTNPMAPPQVPFVASGYTTVDVLGYYAFDNGLNLNFGVYNLFDTKYFLYSETRSLFVGPEVERRAQAGRNVAVSLSMTF